VSAAVAEIAVGRIGFAALGTGYFEPAAAFVAESGVGRIIELALGALHFSFTIRCRIFLRCLFNNKLK
jgi:hypothetical protein